MQVKDVPIKVVFKNSRGRRIALLAPGSNERSIAEQVKRLREAGVTMREISRQVGLSVSTLRRMMNRLLLTQEVEAGVHDKEIARYLPGAKGRKPNGEDFRPAGQVRAVARPLPFMRQAV